ncbi:SagB/ThcOx family dehydrogenase [Streptomyces sp. NPDC086091]|uniref:nitroreductase family protein n=1 Tax=Streptomyces sp. NPDC086091 TaxID=3365751 RepID=UPI0038194FBD
MDLTAALARARSPQPPGPDTPAGPAVRTWPGPARRIPRADPGALDLDALLRLSLAAADGTGRLRPASSAGALHPVDTELVVGADCSLPPGRYGYDPLRHRVHPLGGPPTGTPPGVRAELTVSPRRTASHYGHRAWPLLLLDTGHAAAALLLAARALRVGPARTEVDGHTATPLATVHVPDPGPLPDTAGPTPDRTPPTYAPKPADAPTPAELLARRSAPPPLHGTPTPEALRDVLRTAERAGGGALRWCATVGPPRPGLVALAPDGTTLRRLAAGEARPTLAVWAAGQAWLAQAGAVVLGRGCPDDADAPHIRRAHLHAGLAVHLAHHTAHRHGLAARPVGSWQRADLGAALGGPPGRDWIVHGLALGTHHADEENTT